MNDDKTERARLQHARALEAIAAINGGANPGHEAYVLANEFTDSQTARLALWWRRLRAR